MEKIFLKTLWEYRWQLRIWGLCWHQPCSVFSGNGLGYGYCHFFSSVFILLCWLHIHGQNITSKQRFSNLQAMLVAIHRHKPLVEVCAPNPLLNTDFHSVAARSTNAFRPRPTHRWPRSFSFSHFNSSSIFSICSTLPITVRSSRISSRECRKAGCRRASGQRLPGGVGYPHQDATAHPSGCGPLRQIR